MNKEAIIVNFVLAAREMARAGVPRHAHSIQNFSFAATGEHCGVVNAGLDPDKIVDKVWKICGKQ